MLLSLTLLIFELLVSSFKKKDLLSIIIIDKLNLIIIRLSCHLWIIFIQSFKLDIERSLCSMRKYRSGIFSRKKLELVWLDFLKKKLFLSRIARIAFTIVVSSRCEFSCTKKKRKEERKSNEIVSHRRRYVPIIVDNRLWRKLILRILKSILLLHVSQKFRGYERCKATFIQRRSTSVIIWNKVD